MQTWLNLGFSAVMGGAIALGGLLTIEVNSGLRNAGVMADFSGAALAQQEYVAQQGDVDNESISDETVEQFAKVVLALEPFRVEALEQTNSTADQAAQNEIRREFIRQATDVIESFEMTVPDYNRITIQLRDDAALKTRIEDAIRIIQAEDA